MAVVTAMANGCVPMCLLGSLLIYKEKVTTLQIAGSLICLTGILTMTLPTVFLGKKDTDTTTTSDDVSVSSEKALKTMVINSAIAMLLLSVRMNMAKYCTRILSSLSFLKYNCLADSICALFVVILSAFGVIRVPLSTYLDIETMKIGLSAGASGVIAELFVVLALNEGPTGPVSAIVSFNAVLVSILVWILTGIPLTVL